MRRPTCQPQTGPIGQADGASDYGEQRGRGTFSRASSEAAENRAADVRQDVYKQAGVDTAEADAGLNHIIRRVQGTWPTTGMV
jgi:hypothetical protein